MNSSTNGEVEYDDDEVIAEQARIMEMKGKGKKAKVHREGEKFDSANYEKEKQTAQQKKHWFI